MTSELPPSNRRPTLEANAFDCPSCGVLAMQRWRGVMATGGPGLSNVRMEDYRVATCDQCDSDSIWRNDVMVYPFDREGEAPHSDMPEAVLAIYDEARSVAPLSKKSAAGLLRLALQMLVDELEPGRGTIDAKIGALVKRGLDPQVQQAMDVLRVVGNESVHPGTIDLEADDDLLPGLFNLINIIVEQVVARPKHVGGLFARLPQAKLDAIQKRDS